MGKETVVPVVNYRTWRWRGLLPKRVTVEREMFSMQTPCTFRVAPGLSLENSTKLEWVAHRKMNVVGIRIYDGAQRLLYEDPMDRPLLVESGDHINIEKGALSISPIQE